MIVEWRRKEQTWTARWNGVQLRVALDTATNRWAAFANGARHPRRWHSSRDAMRAVDGMISKWILREMRKNMEVGCSYVKDHA